MRQPSPLLFLKHMKILWLEDRGNALFYPMEVVRSAGHTVLHAFNIYDANGILRGDVDALIVDLNIDTAGLKDSQKLEVENGLFAGWIWLRDTVFPRRPDLKPRTILFTEYFGALREKVTEEGLSGLAVVTKGSGVGRSEELLQRLNSLPSGDSLYRESCNSRVEG